MECNTKLKWVSTLFERLIHFQQEKGLFSILISLHQSIYGNATGCTLKESSRKSFFFRVLQVFCFNRTWTFILTKNVFLGKRCISNAKCAYWKYKQIHTITAARYNSFFGTIVWEAILLKYYHNTRGGHNVICSTGKIFLVFETFIVEPFCEYSQRPGGVNYFEKSSIIDIWHVSKQDSTVYSDILMEVTIFEANRWCALWG